MWYEKNKACTPYNTAGTARGEEEERKTVTKQRRNTYAGTKGEEYFKLEFYKNQPPRKNDYSTKTVEIVKQDTAVCQILARRKKG